MQKCKTTGMKNLWESPFIWQISSGTIGIVTWSSRNSYFRHIFFASWLSTLSFPQLQTYCLIKLGIIIQIGKIKCKHDRKKLNSKIFRKHNFLAKDQLHKNVEFKVSNLFAFLDHYRSCTYDSCCHILTYVAYVNVKFILKKTCISTYIKVLEMNWHMSLH